MKQYPTQSIKKKRIWFAEREYDLLEFLDDNEGLSIDQISKKLGWNSSLVNHYISKLEEKGLVKTKIEIVNHRSQKKVYINEETGVKDMLDLKEIDPKVLEEFKL
ncbi:MAG: MarR family transcriptional regulator [Methanosarcinales archaeon]